MQDIKSLPISKGVSYLAQGYIDYAEEVISNRAIVNLYDGLKPVNRYILWSLYTNGGFKRLTKSTRVAGNVLAYHPHGDSAVYKASVPMTDRSKAFAFPLLKGSGNFGDVSSGSGASAARYTEEMLHENAQEFFNELDGVDMIPNYDATLQEPTVLPVSFPNVLVNASEGIAVGFSSKIPSFNINDVLDLCIEYLQNGECTTVIAPDFVTKGYYIQNNKELQKLMRVGTASIKLRGKVVIQGKKILVTEVAYGKPITSLKKQIQNKEIKNIVNVGNISDFGGATLSIECRNKSCVDSVLYDLYKDTDLQYNYHANIVVVQNGVPKTMGVWKVIETWIQWRREVVIKHLNNEVENLKQKMRESDAFMTLINMTDVKNEFVSRVSNGGRKSACEWLKEQIGDKIPDDLFKFVSTRRLDMYYDGGELKSAYDKAKAELDVIVSYLDNVDTYLIDKFKALKSRYGSSCSRRTEITNVDYNFAKEEEVQVDTSTCYYAIKDNFIKKLRYPDDNNEYDYQFEASATDILIGFDNRGRVLRVYTQDLPFCGISDMGVYLPRYFELTDEDDDYRVMWMSPLDGGTKALLYSDGTMGFLDTSEWVDTKRQVKVLKNGISQYSDLIVEVFDELPEILMVCDNEGRLGWVDTSTIKRKNRVARTRVWNIKNGNSLTSYALYNKTDLLVNLNKPSNYEAPNIRLLQSETDFRGDDTEFIGL